MINIIRSWTKRKAIFAVPFKPVHKIGALFSASVYCQLLGGLMVLLQHISIFFLDVLQLFNGPLFELFFLFGLPDPEHVQLDFDAL